MSEGSSFRCSDSGREYIINSRFNCDSSGIVYVLGSKVCYKQYVGSTFTPFRVRFIYIYKYLYISIFLILEFLL